jgi:hypothetical protein
MVNAGSSKRSKDTTYQHVILNPSKDLPRPGYHGWEIPTRALRSERLMERSGIITCGMTDAVC